MAAEVIGRIDSSSRIRLIHPYVRWLLSIMLIVVAPAFAAEPGEELTISILTFEPGDMVFENSAQHHLGA